jgi:predicted nucleic acid-binding protein
VEALLAPYAERGRVVVPSFQAYVEAGRVLATLGAGGAVGSPALTNDAVIATSCREAEVVLVTGNSTDFDAIQRQLRGFRFATAAKALGSDW